MIQRRFAVVLATFVAITASELRHCPAQVVNQTKEGIDRMTKEEESLLRAIIYGEGFSTHYRKQYPGGREVAMNRKVLELHKNKRIGTLKLLLDIVKGGRPTDAISAGVTAVALERSPVMAAAMGDISPESLDKANSETVTTVRDRMAKMVEEVLSDAEKQSKAAGSK